MNYETPYMYFAEQVLLWLSVHAVVYFVGIVTGAHKWIDWSDPN